MVSERVDGKDNNGINPWECGNETPPLNCKLPLQSPTGLLQKVRNLFRKKMRQTTPDKQSDKRMQEMIWGLGEWAQWMTQRCSFMRRYHVRSRK